MIDLLVALLLQHVISSASASAGYEVYFIPASCMSFHVVMYSWCISMIGMQLPARGLQPVIICTTSVTLMCVAVQCCCSCAAVT